MILCSDGGCIHLEKVKHERQQASQNAVAIRKQDRGSELEDKTDKSISIDGPSTMQPSKADSSKLPEVTPSCVTHPKTTHVVAFKERVINIMYTLVDRYWAGFVIYHH
ncbi:hypothetical protein NDU88_004493 [Pleurodeles waltl]|uniref:Uncharacterized protein n=1 Tax=Pleurodeles waltl TaxID=8319 RepID=A0AAV7SIZ9_PLEWA|nr:hypothetical protein NDU88_004493 [Pleurodeles waltl]